MATATGKAKDTMTDKERNELLARIAQLEAENKANAERKLTFKVSEKGALSVYGMGRFPVTLYAEQWAKLFDASDDIKSFIVEHKSELKFKGQD